MKRFAVAGGLMAFAIGGMVLADEKALQELEGTYKVVAAEKGGKAIPDEARDKLSLTFKGESLTISFDGMEKTGKIKADSTKTPKHIDISPSDGPEKGKTFPGIYKLDKGELTLAYSEKGDRPKDFKSEGEVTLLKMKKDEKK